VSQPDDRDHVAATPDHIIRALVDEPLVRIVAAITTDVAREASRRHGAVGGAQIALGRASTTGLLLATLTKGGERVTLQISADGKLGEIMADANDAGDVRAYVQNPNEIVAAGADERVSLVSGVGQQGVVCVLRDLGLKERFTGQSPLIAGEIDIDVEYYLRVSEQIESALGCEVILESPTEVGKAGGLLAQCMPGSEGLDVVRDLRHKMRNGRLFDALRTCETAEDMVLQMIGGDADRLEVLDLRSVRFHCPCTAERVTTALESFDRETLEQMIREDGGAEVTCNFCRARYDVPLEELEELIAKRS
jgi:molecular chaperone Hsp33